MRRKLGWIVAISALAVGGPLAAQGEVEVFSNGSDGPLNVTISKVIELSAAETDDWDSAREGDRIGKGVYDPKMWAVVFHYTEVTVAAGAAVTFKNHSSRAPVVWLVDGDVVIDGTVNVDGSIGSTTWALAEPGPGGFRGGIIPFGSNLGGNGLGPGGSRNSASYGTDGSEPTGAIYGNAAIVPLVGGSGGNAVEKGGGAGGGAILIAARGIVRVNGMVGANGGDVSGSSANTVKGGSGGAIRIVAVSVEGSGLLLAGGGSNNISRRSGFGRIRVEVGPANSIDPRLRSDPELKPAIVGDTAMIWPASTAPTVRVARILTPTGPVSVPADPRARFDFPNADVNLQSGTGITVEIEATNVPADWSMLARIVPKHGLDALVPATRVSGAGASSTWQATFTPPTGFFAVQVRASRPD